jgi:DNA repair exonuclease SbcCD nuclease subunit
VRLAILSDLHWTQTPAARASWHNVYDFAGLADRLGRARAVGERARVDAVIACGDLTHAGDEASARAALERLSARALRPVLVVAGNHDCLERDDQLARCATGRCAMLTTAGVEVGGVRVAGVGIEHDADADAFRWTGDGELAAGERPLVVASHFPVVSRAERLAERGLAYPGDLANRHALEERLTGAGPVVVLSGHIHARDSHAHGSLLQLSAGALVEAPYEVAIVDVVAASPGIRVRRRALVLGPAEARHDPVLAPDDETWALGAGGWRRTERAA